MPTFTAPPDQMDYDQQMRLQDEIQENQEPAPEEQITLTDTIIPTEITHKPTMLTLNIAGGHDITPYTLARTIKAIQPALIVLIHHGLEAHNAKKAQAPKEAIGKLRFENYTTIFPSLQCPNPHTARGETQGIAFIVRNDVHQNHKCSVKMDGYIALG